MDFHHNSPPESGKLEQIVSHFLLKTLHIILASRIPSLKPQDCGSSVSSSGSTQRKIDKWFSLVLGDRPAALESLRFWQRSLTDPMVIDIIGVHQGEGSRFNGDLCATGSLEGMPVETVIERWVVQYEGPKLPISQKGDFSSFYKKMYKKLIILLRSVHTMMRLLPAYRIFKHLSLANQSSNYDVIYKVSSFSNLFSREEEKMMKQHSFVPVEAVNGRLCISVIYRSMLSEFNLESSPSFPPMIIADYVGSPATDPMRFFPSTPVDRGANETSFSGRSRKLPPSPTQRPHSWSSGIHIGAAYMQNQTVNVSPPAYQGSYVPSDFASSPKSIQGQRVQNPRFSISHGKSSSYDEHQLSPPFSPSSSPSNPAHLFGYSPSKSRLRAESAPVAIPHPMLNQSSKYPSPNLSDPSRNLLPPLSPRSTKLERSLSESPSPSGFRSSRRNEAMRPGELNSGINHLGSSPKVSKESREDSGRFSGLLSSGSSPRVGFSRTSSRLSFQEDLDVCDFSLPFDVDDVDTSDSQSSHSLDTKRCLEFTNPTFSMGRKSQEAAVGALIQMLRTAPPLQQDSSIYSSSQYPSTANQSRTDKFGSASGFVTARKASDALEELRSFREMKEILVSKSCSSQLLSKESIGSSN
ncbi:hypothetical protein V2J09_003723 [Rumex salicifolius]